MLKRILSRFSVTPKNDLDIADLLAYSTNKNLYKKAFIHKSFNHKTNNENLEFLGDAILSAVVAELLFLENPNKEEGFLSQKKSIIVSRKHLNIIGRDIVPETNIKSNLKTIPSNIFGNVLEAIIGAIYLDKGLHQTKKFIKKNIYHSKFLKQLSDIDFKSKLLKYSQKKGIKIEYKIEREQGLDHQKEFLVSVFLNHKKKAEGMACSKKEAEQKAAKKALQSVISKQ